MTKSPESVVVYLNSCNCSIYGAMFRNGLDHRVLQDKLGDSCNNRLLGQGADVTTDETEGADDGIVREGSSFYSVYRHVIEGDIVDEQSRKRPGIHFVYLTVLYCYRLE